MKEIENTVKLAQNVEQSVQPYLQTLEQISSALNSTATTAVEYKRLSSQVEMTRMQMNLTLQSMLIEAHDRSDHRHTMAPIIGRQLDAIQNRIDKFADKMLEVMNDFTPHGMATQKFLMDFIERENNSFREMSMNLMR